MSEPLAPATPSPTQAALAFAEARPTPVLVALAVGGLVAMAAACVALGATARVGGRLLARGWRLAA